MQPINSSRSEGKNDVRSEEKNNQTTVGDEREFRRKERK